MMDKLPNGNFQLVRAVPPGHVKFFFSNLSGQFKSEEFRIKYLDIPFKNELHYGGGYSDTVNIHAVNIRAVAGDECGIKYQFGVKPRVLAKPYVPPKVQLERIPWSIPISLFRDYKFDTEESLCDCFEFD